jgi:mono/diheme cytochrome c family protein
MAKDCIQKKLRDRGIILPGLPRAVKYLIWIFTALALVPVAIVYHARMSRSDKPRIHLIQDMDNQPGYRTQASSTIFADGRAARQPILTTVAYGKLEADDHFYRGYEMVYNATTKQSEPKYFTGMPAMNVDKALLERGQQRFNIYCAPCHGYDAHGNGSVAIRATTLGTTGTQNWVPPINLTQESTRNLKDGELFNAIGNGIRNMPAMGSQIPVEDRWAIVAYVRALQIRQPGAQATESKTPKTDGK